MNAKFPLRFFAISFAWTWLFFAPLVLMGAGIIPASDALVQGVTIPATMIAAFGPAAGAFASLRSLNGKGAIRNYVKPFLSLKFGWKTWTLLFAVLGLSSFEPAY
jgi:hypothetical protein